MTDSLSGPTADDVSSVSEMELRAIRERREALRHDDVGRHGFRAIFDHNVPTDWADALVAFILAAPRDVRLLLDEVQALRAHIAQQEQSVEELKADRLTMAKGCYLYSSSDAARAAGWEVARRVLAGSSHPDQPEPSVRYCVMCPAPSVMRYAAPGTAGIDLCRAHAPAFPRPDYVHPPSTYEDSTSPHGIRP